MSDNPYFPRLFSSLEVGERTLRNRVVLSATLTNYGAGHRVTDRWTNFLAERAKGGCGAIITEVIAVDPAALAHGAIVAGYDERERRGFQAYRGGGRGRRRMSHRATLAPGASTALEPGVVTEGHLGPAGRL